MAPRLGDRARTSPAPSRASAAPGTASRVEAAVAQAVSDDGRRERRSCRVVDARRRCPRWTSPAASRALREPLRRRRHRRAARHPPPERPLPHRLHRQRGDAARHRRRVGVHLRRPLPHPGRRAARGGRRRRRASRSAPPSPSNATRSRPRSVARRRVGLEAHAVTLGAAARRSPTVFAGARARRRPTASSSELRRVKEPGEVARIRAACAIADDALGALLPRLADAADRARLRARARGRDAPPRRERQQLRPDRRLRAQRRRSRTPARATGAIERGELVVIDFGCIVDGYCSDMTRTVSVGDPGPEARRVWDVVRESQWAGREAVRAGADCAAVDRACRDVIVAAGWGDAFVHGTGHGVGPRDPRGPAGGRERP